MHFITNAGGRTQAVLLGNEDRRGVRVVSIDGDRAGIASEYPGGAFFLFDHSLRAHEGGTVREAIDAGLRAEAEAGRIRAARAARRAALRARVAAVLAALRARFAG